jgi:hypothetical protein
MMWVAELDRRADARCSKSLTRQFGARASSSCCPLPPALPSATRCRKLRESLDLEHNMNAISIYSEFIIVEKAVSISLYDTVCCRPCLVDLRTVGTPIFLPA